MNEITFANIKRVEQTYDKNEANQHLDCGWLLLGVFQQTEPDGAPAHASYVLGCPSDEPPVEP